MLRLIRAVRSVRCSLPNATSARCGCDRERPTRFQYGSACAFDNLPSDVVLMEVDCGVPDGETGLNRERGWREKFLAKLIPPPSSSEILNRGHVHCCNSEQLGP